MRSTEGDGRTLEPDDRTLLDAIRRGEEPALRELLARHAPSVFRFALRMCRNRDDAEDVAQETLLAAARGAKDVRDASSLSTWFYAVARSFCIKMRRRQKHAPNIEIPADGAREMPAAGSSPDDTAAANELVAALDEAIERLEDKYRAVILLRDVEGLSAPEVAEALGISVDAVKSRLHRARAAVRARLGPLVPGAEASGVPAGNAPCPEIGATFSRYLEGEIGPDECATMQRHVDTCGSCSAVCAGLRQTVSLCREAGTAPMPEDLRARVRRALERALAAAGPSTVNASGRPPKA